LASPRRVDWSKAHHVTLPNLRPSTRTLSLRLPESMLEALKLLANQRDVPYQSLIKVFLVERIQAEQGRDAACPPQPLASQVAPPAPPSGQPRFC
jgi:hypothetical protein